MTEAGSVYLHTINIVVKDMERALSFYRLLGLNIPLELANDPHVELSMANGASVGFDTEEVIREGNPEWITPVGQRVSFAFQCPIPEVVTVTYQRLTDAGYIGLKAPWDAFWGQRYAMIQDPDGNRVDIFAELPESSE